MHSLFFIFTDVLSFSSHFVLGIIMTYISRAAGYIYKTNIGRFNSIQVLLINYFIIAQQAIFW